MSRQPINIPSFSDSTRYVKLVVDPLYQAGPHVDPEVVRWPVKMTGDVMDALLEYAREKRLYRPKHG